MAAKYLMGWIMRTGLFLTVGASGVAVMVGRSYPAAGRSIPDGPSFRKLSNRMFSVVNGTALAPSCDRPFLIDPENRGLVRLDVEGDAVLKNASISPCQDERGEWQVAGGWRPRPTGQWGVASHEAGLLRATFPGGQVLDRIVCDPVPIGTPCWYPGRSDRILYPTTTGSLYQYRFRDEDEVDPSRTPRPTPRRLTWLFPQLGTSVMAMLDPTWPTDSRFRRRLLVSVVQRIEGAEGMKCTPWQIWWLRLDEEGDSIEAAGLLTEPDPTNGMAPCDQRFPSLLSSHDGLLLAYLTLMPHPIGWQLHVAPVEIDPASGIPRVQVSKGRILAGQRLPVRPVFSADGHWVVSARHDADPSQPRGSFPIGDVRLHSRSAVR